MLQDTLAKYERRAAAAAAAAGTSLEHIVLDLSPVTDIDATAVHFIKDTITAHKARGVQLIFSNPSTQVKH